MKSARLLLQIILSLLLFTACGNNLAKQEDTTKVALTTTSSAPAAQTAPIAPAAPPMAPAPAPTQVASKARVDFKSADHVAAAKDRITKDHPDSFTLQKTLQDMAVEDQRELEKLVNSLTDAEWSKLEGSYNRIVSSHNDSPTLVYQLFQMEIESFRSMK